MNKEEINKIAKKLGWKDEEVAEAFRKLSSKKSVIKDWERFLMICAEAENSEDRWLRIQSELWRSLYKKNLTRLVCQWVREPDPLFSVCVLFNAIDLIPKGVTLARNDIALKVLTVQLQKDRVLTMDIGAISLMPVEVTATLLCDKFLSYLIMRKNEAGEKNIGDLLSEVISKVGFLAFNITIFRQLAEWSTLDPQKFPFVKGLVSGISEYYSSSDMSMERAYWQCYALVEKLKTTYGLRSAFKEAAFRLNAKSSSVERRYWKKRGRLRKKVFPSPI